MGDRRFDLGNLSVNNDFDADAESACWRPTTERSRRPAAGGA